MAGNSDFLHIKRHTAGSSNELSLDVLDHKRAEVDAKSQRSSRFAFMPGETASAGVGGVVQKRSFNTLLVVLAVALAVVFAGLLVYTGVTTLEEQADFPKNVRVLVEGLSEVDETLAQADALMAAPLNEENTQVREDIVSKIPQLTTTLNRISVDAQSMESYASNNRDSFVARQLNEAAQARSDMLSEAGETFRLTSEVLVQESEANRIWDKVVAADQAARESIVQANRASTEPEMRESLEKTRSAREGFSTALADLKGISLTYSVDFSAYESYLSKKVEALDLAVKTSDALLAGKRDEAIAANDTYNATDAEAARLAEDLPASISSLVLAQFEEDIAVHRSRYAEARERTVQADATIREYLS